MHANILLEVDAPNLVHNDTDTEFTRERVLRRRGFRDGNEEHVASFRTERVGSEVPDQLSATFRLAQLEAALRDGKVRVDLPDAGHAARPPSREPDVRLRSGLCSVP
jgi:hypothetical protein